MRTFLLLLISHAVLLVLASTNFSVISWLWGDHSWTWNYFQYSYRNGWGHPYASEYSLGQVLCYITAYGLGALAFAIGWLRYRLRLSVAATVLCLLGTLSFCIEATHWLWTHHLSWIASFPAVMIVLWMVVGVQAFRLSRENPQQGRAVDREDATADA
ncbi:MAG: hypothetical protein GY851_10915 [bacterium]|nr:hypothetical protein [bacterium]